MRKVFSLGLLIAATILVTFSSCKGNTPDVKKKVTGVKLSETTKTIKVGEEFTLTATVEPADADVKNVTWSSSKPAIATVENGKVKGISDGIAIITVTTIDGKKTDKCTVTVTKEDNGPTQADMLLFGYVGNLKVEGKHFYSIILTEKGMVNNGKVTKDGACYYITICSDAPKAPDNKDFSPRMGTYKMGKQGQFEPMFIVNHKNLTYAGKFEGGEIAKDKTPFTEGELVVEANKITFKGKDADSKSYNIVFEGTYTVVDASPNPFPGEPKTATNVSQTWNNGELKVAGQNAKVKAISLSTSPNNENMIAYVFFFVEKTATKLTEGTYSVTDDMEKNTVIKSKGAEEKDGKTSLYASFIGKRDGSAFTPPIYYFDSGTVTVTAKDITFNVKSHFGSTLNLKYTGSMDVKSGNGAPQKLQVLSPMKLRKVIAF